ncbi:complement C1q subcomponent subunit C-like [Babylonia areolata]|uniref:complement C1q subcomponent subunit C-like n=1 Tax=Babylonia areolata TaxID=304850 RepID=UPI003FCFFCB0
MSTILKVLLFYVLFHANSATEANRTSHHQTGHLSLVTLVVKQAIQLQDQARQLRQLEEKVALIAEHQKSSNESRPVQAAAFRATLRYEDVIANIRFGTEFVAGQGDYNPHTGAYTVAVPGVYLFGVQLLLKGEDNSDTLVDLIVNSSIKIRSHCSKSHAYCYASSVLRVKKGDTVWVQTERRVKCWPGVHTFFFGALISADP